MSSCTIAGRCPGPAIAAAMTAMALLAAPGPSLAQLNVRPEDPLGMAIRETRVRVIHSDSADPPGASMHLQETDPWLAYQLGRSYFFREWGSHEGVSKAIVPRLGAAVATSCNMCHNLPFHSFGAGGNIAEPLGFGRNTPHTFGVGLVETLAIQIRQQIMAAHDANRNGYFDVPSETRGRRAVVEATPGVPVDFGALDDLDGDGFPDLNAATIVRFFDRQGRLVENLPDGRAPKLGDPDVAGFDLLIAPFASSLSDHQFPVLRSFSVGVLSFVMGIRSEDPTTSDDAGKRRDRSAGDGWCETSNAGAPQPKIPAVAVTYGRKLDPKASAHRMTEGELDLLEWALLNHPSPGRGPRDEQALRGRRLMDEMHCTRCHVADWQIQPADERLGLPGDRRFFDLAVAFEPSARGLRGRLTDLTSKSHTPGGTEVRRPRRGGYLVREIFTDFVHHDMGEKFYEVRLQGNEAFLLREYKTPALWGVGSSAPYGHDGRSATLDEIIRRHGGEAEEAARAYAEGPESDREAVVSFLRSLVLYQPDMLPTDLNGDGVVEDDYRIGGLEAGPEWFRPELLFRRAPRYRGWTVGPDGDRFFSLELLNVGDAYGRTLEGLVDEDGDEIPDILTRTARKAR